MTRSSFISHAVEVPLTQTPAASTQPTTAAALLICRCIDNHHGQRRREARRRRCHRQRWVRVIPIPRLRRCPSLCWRVWPLA